MTPTIMLAPYPVFDTNLDFHADALKYELGLRSVNFFWLSNAQSFLLAFLGVRRSFNAAYQLSYYRCVQGIRSLVSEFNVRTNGCAFIKTSTADSYENVEPQIPAIKALCKKAISELKVVGPDAVGSSIPRGCAIFVISADIVVMVEVVASITDIDVEISKLRSKLQKSRGIIERQQELMAHEGFEEKVSDVVRSAERKKLSDAEAATENYERTIEEFEKLSLTGAESA
jgi:valyl-tRNA synthetase